MYVTFLQQRKKEEMCVFFLSKLLLVKHRTPNLAPMASPATLVAAPPVNTQDGGLVAPAPSLGRERQ